jgi:tRNA_anti-like
VSVFLERYILPILAALTLLVIVSNPLHFSWGQRIMGGSIVVLAAALVSRVAHRLNKKLQTSAETVDAGPAKQESSSLPPKLTGGRVFVRVEPDYLMAFFKDHTAIQAKSLLAAFLDKWMRVSGKLDNVTPGGTHSILVTIDRPMTSQINMFFDQKDWKDRLAILRRGDSISVVGQLTEADMHAITLCNCELEDN